MDGRAAIHVAGRPLLVSTNSQTWDTLVNQLWSVAIKSRPKPTQSIEVGMSGHKSAGPLRACVKVADYSDPTSTGTLTCIKSLETFVSMLLRPCPNNLQ
jgi:hypothetical protein